MLRRRCNTICGLLPARRPSPTDETSEYAAGKRPFAGGEQHDIHARAVRVAGITPAADIVEGPSHGAQDAADHGPRECAVSRVPRSRRDDSVREPR